MTGPDHLASLSCPRPGPSRRRWGGAWPGALLAALVGLVAVPAWAKDPCEGAVTQLDLNLCTDAAFRAADEALNRAYGDAIEAARRYDASPEGQAEATLRAAQRAWIAYRDAACAAEAALWEGGSAQPMIRSGCLARLTDQRTDDLKAYAEQ